MAGVEIIIQPTKSATGKLFSSSAVPCFLKCGCVLTSKEAARATSKTGFVYCGICDFSYTIKDKDVALLLSESSSLNSDHIRAQEKRCGFYEKEIQFLQEEMDVMITEAGVTLTEEEKGMDWILESEPSSVEDESDLEPDYLEYEGTAYAIVADRLKKLKNFRDGLVEQRKSKIDAGSQMGAPWVDDPYWMFPEETSEYATVKAKQAQRNERKAQRQSRYAAKRSIKGPSKIVHNVHVLGKNIPKKWRDTDPNAEPEEGYALKLREKQGWLTEQEQEDMDEDEQNALTEKRRAEWMSEQSPVPQVYGSVSRQRWADRLYKIARRRHYFQEKIAALGDAEEKEAWTTLLATHEYRLADTRAKCTTRLDSIEKLGRYESAYKLSALFERAEQIGADEVKKEIAEREAAEAAAKAAAEAAEAARLKEEEKAKAKAEAEARGEVWVDPDAAEDGEGDDEDDEEN